MLATVRLGTRVLEILAASKMCDLTEFTGLLHCRKPVATRTARIHDGRTNVLVSLGKTAIATVG
jgi:hypothetical protein